MREEPVDGNDGRRAIGRGVRGIASVTGGATAAAMTAVLLLAACQRTAEPPADGARAGPPAAGTETAPASGAAGAGVAAGGSAAATSESGAGATGAERADRITAAAAQWPKVEGRWTRGDTDSRYTAYFDGERLRYLDERMGMGDYGSRRHRYWFDDGALFYYEGEKSSDVPGGTKPGMLPPVVPVVAEFRGGEVVRAVAREHYGEKKLDDATVAGIRNHAAALAGAAQDEWSAQHR
jgi:hypothetical protein